MSTILNFCTFFDRSYAARGLALYRSLERHCSSAFQLTILCVDRETREGLARLTLPHARLILAEDMGDAELLEVRKTRQRREFCWTCTAPLMLSLLRNLPDGAIATYLDADMLFFGSPQPVFDELGDMDIFVHGHNFAPQYESRAAYSGIFNVGLIAVRKSAQGLACVERWRAQCLDVCMLDPEQGYCGDQKYLDEWPNRYDRLVISRHPGVGLAPWNVATHDIVRTSNRVTVDGKPLIFYHYHGLRIAWARWPWAVVPADGYDLKFLQRRLLYRPYIRMLRRAYRELSAAPDIPRPQTPFLGFLRHLRHQKLMFG